MIFKMDNLISILMHDFKIIDPWAPRWHYLGGYARTLIKNRYRRPWANAHIYLDNWTTFVRLLRREWHPVHVPGLDSRLASALSIDPGPQLKDMMRARELRQRDLARVLEVTEAFVSSRLKGRQPWPSGKLVQAIEWVVNTGAGQAGAESE